MLYCVQLDGVTGRHLIATVDIPTPGTNVIIEKAYPSSSHEENLKSCCLGCQCSIPIDKRIHCDSCGLGYCLSCHEIYNEYHANYECEQIDSLCSMAERIGIDMGLVLLIFRTCIRGVLETIGEYHQIIDEQSKQVLQQLHKSSIPHTTFDLVRSLETHIQDIDPEHAYLFRRIAPDLILLVTNVVPSAVRIIDESIVVDLFCIVQVNAHGICADGFASDSGVGLFPIVSLLSHSCIPNCCFITVGDVIHVRSLTSIKTGEDITIAYVDLMLPTHLRRSDLLRTKFFYCKCQRCESATECGRYMRGIRCNSCKDGYVVPHEQEIVAEPIAEVSSFDHDFESLLSQNDEMDEQP